MRTLDRKLLRNLWSLKGQGAAIGAVIAAGVAMLVMSLVVLDSLRLTQAAVYQDQRFAHVFAALKRAPEPVAARLRELPGVATVETRVVAPVNVLVEGFDDPVTGLLMSVPDGSQPELNRLHLRDGALPDPLREDEVVVSDAFADAHGFQVGDRVGVVIGGRFQRLTIAGMAMSPEHVYQIRPGELYPDHARYAIMWMNRRPLAAAFGMEGAFNSLTATITPGYGQDRVIEGMDAVLAPWGGLGAYGRDDQVSHRILTDEIDSIEVMARILPAIFLGVAAFLLNVVTARLIRTQREQIAILKAFGYDSLTVALHYLSLVLAIVAVGAVVGVIAGTWLAQGMGVLYQSFFRFPYLEFRLRPGIALLGVLVAGGAAVVGTLGALRAAFRLPPAEAMRPEPPARYRRTVLERLGAVWLSQPARMVLRNLERQPVKSGLSMLGIAFAVAMLMTTGFQEHAVRHMVDVQFRLSQQQDLTVTFHEPASERAVFELAAYPGVEYVEAFRSVPAVLRNGHRSYRTAVQGYEADARLHHVLDDRLRTVPLPPDGILLTDHLGRHLGVGPGDRLRVEVLEGRRVEVEIPVAALVTEFVGVGAYMRRDALARHLGEGPQASGVLIVADPAHHAALNAALENAPRVAGVTLRETAIRSFTDVMDETMMTFVFFSMLLAGSIAFAVVYNNARIAFSERARELASLRVLGFTRGEVASILIGEVVLLTLLAMPFGFALGALLVWLLTLAFQTDLYRIPFVLPASAFASAAATVLVATLLSTLTVGRKLKKLDMISALKAAE